MAEKEIPGFTRHPRGGWVRTYRGRTLWCGGANATRDEVERTFAAKRDAADREGTADGPPTVYRELLSVFLEAMEQRVRTGKPKPLRPRTLHNLVVTLNDFGAFVGGGSRLEDVNRPDVFAAYGRRFADWKASGFDSVVTRVGALFRWAERMEYIDRFRPGPEFQRPAKADLRDDRIDLSKSFSPDEFAKLYAAANGVMRCWLGLGLFAAMNNSEVANLSRDTVDLAAAVPVIDFRRRKKGRVRRVCPLPELVARDLRTYVRPEPAHADDAGLFFVTEYGNAYAHTRRRDGKPSDSMSRMFRELMADAGVEHRRGRNFSGLRTTFRNLAPRGGWDTEREIVMGHSHGNVDLDNYLEDVGLDRLCQVVEHVYGLVSTALAGSVTGLPAAAFASSLWPTPAADTARAGSRR